MIETPSSPPAMDELSLSRTAGGEAIQRHRFTRTASPARGVGLNSSWSNNNLAATSSNITGSSSSGGVARSSSSSTVMYALDWLLSTTLFTALNAFLWRGIWELQSIYVLPSSPGSSAIVSLIFGAFIGLTGHAALPVLARHGANTLIARVYWFLRAVGVISTWRGAWIGIEVWIASVEGPEGTLQLVATLCLVLMILVRQTNVLLAGPPFTLELDHAADFEQATVFRTSVPSSRGGPASGRVWKALPRFSIRGSILHFLDVLFTVWVLDVFSAIFWQWIGEALGISSISPRPMAVLSLYGATFSLHSIQGALMSIIARIKSRLARTALIAFVNLLACFISALLVQALWAWLDKGSQKAPHTHVELFYAALGTIGMTHLGVMSTVVGQGVSYDGARTNEPFFRVNYLTSHDSTSTHGGDVVFRLASLHDRKLSGPSSSTSNSHNDVRLILSPSRIKLVELT